MRAVFLSYIATASSCAEVSRLLPTNYGAVNQLRSFWETLYNSSLLAKALWQMYIEDVLR